MTCPEKEKIALGATNTVGGMEKEINFSLPIDDEKVKKPLDLRTEMFMLNLISNALNDYFIDDRHRSQILSDLISKCEEANEA